VIWISGVLAGIAVAALLRGPPELAVSPGQHGALPSRSSGDDRGRLRPVAAAAAGAGTMLLLGGGFGAVVGLGVAALTWRLISGIEPPGVRRQRERLEADLPHVVDLLASMLAAGLAPGSAVAQVAKAVQPPIRDELGGLDARLRLGVDPVTVWRELSEHPQLGPLGRCVSRAAESGASVADAMLRLSDDLREECRSTAESRARSVGVKATMPLGLCLLPAFVLVGVVPLVASAVTLFTGR
jgi:Flp pilus assembly protein TadB